MELASDVEGSRLVLASTRGDRDSIQVADNGASQI
jgi:hypothetical protein